MWVNKHNLHQLTYDWRVMGYITSYNNHVFKVIANWVFSSSLFIRKQSSTEKVFIRVQNWKALLFLQNIPS